MLRCVSCCCHPISHSHHAESCRHATCSSTCGAWQARKWFLPIIRVPQLKTRVGADAAAVLVGQRLAFDVPLHCSTAGAKHQLLPIFGCHCQHLTLLVLSGRCCHSTCMQYASLLNSFASFAAAPAIVSYSSASPIARVAVATSVLAFALITTGGLHWFTKPYVHQLLYNEQVSAPPPGRVLLAIQGGDAWVSHCSN